jgi:hypothetical protein
MRSHPLTTVVTTVEDQRVRESVLLSEAPKAGEDDEIRRRLVSGYAWGMVGAITVADAVQIQRGDPCGVTALGRARVCKPDRGRKTDDVHRGMASSTARDADVALSPTMMHDLVTRAMRNPYRTHEMRPKAVVYARSGCSRLVERVVQYPCS